MTFQQVLGGGGLSKTELAQLYGVSRQTIHTWARGGAPRAGSYTARMAMVITTAMLGAIAKRLLPLPVMATEKRAERIRKMAATLQNLKPAPIK